MATGVLPGNGGVLSAQSTVILGGAEIGMVEMVAAELTRAWERSGHHQRLTELIQSGISLTTLLDPQAAVQEIALLTRKTFDARFVFVTGIATQWE